LSILLGRLLTQSRDLLERGDVQEAEALCCQVIKGALALRSLPLAIESGRLLGRLPPSGSNARENARLDLFNLVVTQQTDPDGVRALELCDVLFPLIEDDRDLLYRVMEMAVFIASRGGVDRLPYLRRLLEAQRMLAPADHPCERLEIAVADGPATGASILATRGLVVIRGLFDPAAVDLVRDEVNGVFRRESLQAEHVERIPSAQALADGPALDFIRPLLQPFFPEQPQLRPEISWARQVAYDLRGSTVPFHQDFNAFGRFVVNVWVPLIPCGRDAPGLELVARRLDELADTVPAEDQYDELQIDESLIIERFGSESLVIPEFDRGDAVAFLGTTIHRTHITSEMSALRTSLELRFS